MPPRYTRLNSNDGGQANLEIAMYWAGDDSFICIDNTLVLFKVTDGRETEGGVGWMLWLLLVVSGEISVDLLWGFHIVGFIMGESVGLWKNKTISLMLPNCKKVMRSYKL